MARPYRDMLPLNTKPLAQMTPGVPKGAALAIGVYYPGSPEPVSGIALEPGYEYRIRLHEPLADGDDEYDGDPFWCLERRRATSQG